MCAWKLASARVIGANESNLTDTDRQDGERVPRGRLPCEGDTSHGATKFQRTHRRRKQRIQLNLRILLAFPRFPFYNAGVDRPDAITNRGGRSAQQHVDGRRVEGHPSLNLGGPSQRKPARKRAFGPSFLPAFFVFPLWIFLCFPKARLGSRHTHSVAVSAANSRRTP